MKEKETSRLCRQSDRASMRSNALMYRSCIAADYSPDLSVKVRYGAEFLRRAINHRNQSMRHDYV